MKIRDSYNPLIIVGAWNKAIFSPEWISKYIFNGAELNVEVPINNTNASLKFHAKEIALNIVDQRLIFYAKSHNDDLFDLVGETALNLCRFLPHTPVFSYGINHVFEASTEEVKHKGILDIADNQKLNDEYSIIGIKTIRIIKLPDCKLNFTCSQNEDTIIFDFNFHYDIASLENFIQEFDAKKINQKKMEAIQLLHNVYGLTIE